MAFIISGDIHGTLDIGKLIRYFDGKEDKYSKEEDYLIICGDVGVCAFVREESVATRDVLRSLPVTTLFVDGNHENFPELNSYKAEEWNGGKVHFIEDNIIHLMRGQVFNIDGTRFFTFGGACSVDKWARKEGFSWFPEEIPNRFEYEEGWRNLEKNGFNVDYISTHTCPIEAASEMGYEFYDEGERGLRQYLQRVADNTEFTAWYFGHFHEDTDVDDIFICLYEDLIEFD